MACQPTLQKIGRYKDKQSAFDSGWHAPKEFLCPSDVISKKERPDTQWDSWISYGYNLTDWYFSDWFGIDYAGHRNTTVPSPAGQLIFTESNDWWLWWWGANYEDLWDVLGQDPPQLRPGDSVQYGLFIVSGSY